MALATLILENNGYTAQQTEDIFGESHFHALVELKNALLTPPGGNHMALDLVTDDGWNQSQNALNIAANFNDLDPVKLGTSLTNMARAIDLYLALENAYIHYGENESFLLSQQERGDLLEHFGINLKGFFKFNKLEMGDISDVLGGPGGAIFGAIIDQISSAEDLSLNEVQPGNWPYKNFLAIGYASLGMNVSTSGDTPYDNYFNTAYRTSFLSKTKDRTKYWSYQTDNGENFWAEGPFYFHYTLRELIPFWHAVRGNGFYSNRQISYSGLSVQDPFSNSDYTNPLNWLADIATPDGKIPPIDDGNKSSMRMSSLLRWDSNYGDWTIGDKFAAINEQVGGYGTSSNLYLVELGIPRQATGGPMPTGSNSDLTNDSGNDRQLITRRGSGSNTHYVLLNGETGDADNRGEGHEQPDQLQLLYYKGGTSYLMDSGYDKGSLETNSTWNNYFDHNNLAYTEGWNVKPPYNGWETSPILDSDFKPRKVYENHPVLSLSSTDRGKISILKGNMNLVEEEDWGPNRQLISRFGKYERTVLFINAPKPYLIDLNSIEGKAYYFPDAFNSYYEDISGDLSDIEYRLKYFAGADSNPVELSRNGQKWSKFGYSDDDDLYIYMNFLEYENQNLIHGSKTVEECYEGEVARTVELKHTGSRFLNTVSFIQATDNEPSNIPQPLFPYNNQPYQAWNWKQDENTIDVLVKRSKEDMTQYNQYLDFSFKVNGTFVGGLNLPAGKDYGFARLHKNGSVWEIDPDYQINLEAIPLGVSITGPDFLDSGQSGTWRAHVSNSDGPVSYQWYYKTEETMWALPGLGSSSSTFTHTFYDAPNKVEYPAVRVDVSSGGETASAVHGVNVDGGSNGGDDCEGTPSDPSSITINRKKPLPCKVAGKSKAVPETFSVESNYPNPFNPSTTIKFGLPEQAEVTLNVYNILGQNVATLLNETRSAGYYEVRFDASNLASGLYIGRLVANGESGKPFVKELKMQLVK